MESPNPNAAHNLRREILAEARRQKEEVLRIARQEAEELLARAQREAAQARGVQLAAAQLEAKQRTEAILATVAVEVGRLRAVRVEEILQSIHDAARDRLRAKTGLDLRQGIVGLATEALGQMQGDSFLLKLPPKVRSALGDGLVEEIRRCSTRPAFALQVVEDANRAAGDVVIEDQGGRQSWNIGLEARLERCWPELRRQIVAHLPFVEPGNKENSGA
jgi:vacuolar-type H+-ATPase subunit E/Vma4